LSVHKTAIVSAEAQVSPQASIGPFCVITGKVTVGARTVIESHARIGSDYGEVVIGEDNHIQASAALGGPPQDWSYRDTGTRLEIGAHNRIGECATINLGTAKGGGVTRVGNHSFLMAYCHVGHDCQIGDRVVLTNLVQLGGHVVVEDHVMIGGLAAATQFVRLGRLSFLTAGAIANKDIPPYTIAEGQPAVSRATNKIGLKRAGYSAEQIREIDRAVRILLDRSATVASAASRVVALGPPNDAVAHLLEFASGSKRGIARP